MTANAGYHAYATGDVLTAAQVQYNLQNQTVMYFATTTARDAALTGAILVEGMVSYTPATGLMYYNGSAWASVSGSANVPTLSNPVLNSAMQVWQRGTSSTAIATSGTFFLADRWQVVRGGFAAGGSISRQATNDTTNLPNIQYCARVQRDSGNTSTATFIFGQNMETVNAIPFAGKTVTLSYYARAGANYSAASSALGTYLVTGTGTDQNGITGGYTGSSSVINGTAATLTTTWQRFTFSATLASTATEISIQLISSPVGTAGANDYFEITGVQLELGSTATPFDTYATTIQGELAACQRYYYRLTNPTSSYYRFSTGQAISTTTAQIVTQFPVTLRTAPTALEQVGTAGNYTVTSSVGGAVTCSAVPTFDLATTNSANSVFIVSAGLVAGNFTQALNTISTLAYLGWSAEL